jgi:hypothetical protein
MGRRDQCGRGEKWGIETKVAGGVKMGGTTLIAIYAYRLRA